MRRVSLVFGGITMASGLAGVPLGAWLGAALLKRFPRAHPFICGAGLLVSAPAMALGMLLTQYYFYAPFVFMFIGEVALNLNWAIVADMSLYIVIPPRRSTAEAFQILISHMLGDAGSPYLIGVIIRFRRYGVTEHERAVPKLFVTCFVEVIGGAFFLMTTKYIVRDKQKVDRAIAEAEAHGSEASHSQAQEENVPGE
ncbi:Protein spinster [Papilio xuthus]|uniref:Protein spinster n=1 Tax=Papilio xuthus TaxID=66420 RepID=A0A194PTI7_PAPXU|nr:Protein spinster [Papilio xuthus]